MAANKTVDGLGLWQWVEKCKIMGDKVVFHMKKS